MPESCQSGRVQLVAKRKLSEPFQKKDTRIRSSVRASLRRPCCRTSKNTELPWTQRCVSASGEAKVPVNNLLFESAKTYMCLKDFLFLVQARPSPQLDCLHASRTCCLATANVKLIPNSLPVWLPLTKIDVDPLPWKNKRSPVSSLVGLFVVEHVFASGVTPIEKGECKWKPVL